MDRTSKPAQLSTYRMPMYCPRCQKSADEGTVCEHCGEVLRSQGYCEICEGWLLQGVGTECPKHDISLTEGPAESGLDPASTRMVTIATYSLDLEVQGPRLRLEAEGIPVFLDGVRMAASGYYQLATGGIKLQVPEEFAAEARILLAQSWSPVKNEEYDPEDPWEGLEPAHPAEFRREAMKKAIVFYLFWPIAAFMVIFVIALVRNLLS